MKRIVMLLCLAAAPLFATLSPAERLNAKLQNYAQNAFENERWSDAYQAFMRIERTPEALPSIQFYLGRCAYEMGDYDTAEIHFKNVLTLVPGHPTASYELARVHLRYARRHENTARELFAVIPPAELPKEARRAVSAYTGFTRLPHSHRIGGDVGVYAFLDNQAPVLPQLIDPQIPLPDPSPSNTDREQSRGNRVALNLKHRYQESDCCGLKWENRISGGIVNHPGIEDSQATRLYASTRLAFRVEERFWFAPEYFVQNFTFAQNDRRFSREGWAINVEGTPDTDLEVWGRLAWYSQFYKENGTNKHQGLSGLIGGRQHFGIHHAQAELAIDITHDGEAENEIGLYTQSRLGVLWLQRFTPAAAGRIEGDFMRVDFDHPAGKREDKVLAGGIGVELKIADDWAIDYLVKMARTESDQSGGSYTRSLVQLGARYTF